MGKSLIIKGADFSANGIKETVITDVTNAAEASGDFFPDSFVSAFNFDTPSASDTRCCIIKLDIANLVEDITQYDKMRIEIKDGFDYVLGILRESEGTWHRMDGDSESATDFVWVTNNQYVEVPTSQYMLITGNLRYDDNTTTFASTTKLSDLMTITLIAD